MCTYTRMCTTHPFWEYYSNSYACNLPCLLFPIDCLTLSHNLFRFKFDWIDCFFILSSLTPWKKSMMIDLGANKHVVKDCLSLWFWGIGLLYLLRNCGAGAMETSLWLVLHCLISNNNKSARKVGKKQWINITVEQKTYMFCIQFFLKFQ